MNEQLIGCELDKAVALVLGWRPLYIQLDGMAGAWWHPGRGDRYELGPRSYSTDYAALPEMLEWLETHEQGVRMRVAGRGHLWLATALYPDETEVASGASLATFLEAVARLVVEVARQRKETT